MSSNRILTPRQRTKSLTPKMLSEGSLIKYTGKNLCSISVVESVDPPYVWCKATMCRGKDGEWKHMKEIDPEHNAERIDQISLVEPDDFEDVLAQKIIPKKYIRNVQLDNLN